MPIVVYYEYPQHECYSTWMSNWNLKKSSCNSFKDVLKI